MYHARILRISGLVWLAFLLLYVTPTQAENLDRYFDDEIQASESIETVVEKDPLEPVNRFFFSFNDKFYFWFLKPVSTAYATVIPEDFRIVIRNAFNNLLAPVRIVNNLLQGKVKDSGMELSRFAINSTVGIVGLGDVASAEFGIEQKDEDLGQTLAVYGAGEGVFLCWPFLGPSNIRDTLGLIGDGFLSPVNYLSGGNAYATVGIKAGEKVNDTSLTLGDYERFKEAAIDPYVSMRQAYRQYRRNKIKDIAGDSPSDKGAISDNSMERQKKGLGMPVAYLNMPADHASEFAVHVGIAIGNAQADKMRAELLARGKTAAEIIIHQRDGYNFYGVEVPVPGSFIVAKREELRLAEAGYPSAMVVTR